MTAGSLREQGPADRGQGLGGPAPVLVLGLGNLLLGDDGVGLRLVERLAEEGASSGAVDFVDGGTQGLALLGCLADRQAVLVLDAVGLGSKPGAVHVLRGPTIEQLREQIRAPRASNDHRGPGPRTAHEGNALELFATARVLGLSWNEVAVVGVEPDDIRTAIGLSPRVEQSFDKALARAREVLKELVELYVPCHSR